MTNWPFMTLDMTRIKWGAWFASFATASAAKRHITMNYTGPKVPDRDSWVASEIRLGDDGRWQIRLAQHPVIDHRFES